MRKLAYIIFLFSSLTFGQEVNLGGTPAGVAVGAGGTGQGGGSMGISNQAPPLADLELLTLKATPIAEGAGALSRGAFAAGQGTPALGFVNTLSNNVAVTTRSTESWGTALQGSFNELASRNNTVVIMDIAGSVTTDDDYCFRNWGIFLNGDYVSIFQNIGPEFRFEVSVDQGVPQVDVGSCGGFYGTGVKEVVWIGNKMYLRNPTIASPSNGQTIYQLWSSNNVHLSNWILAHGGDQQFDIRMKQRSQQAPYEDFGNITMEYLINANGFGSGTILGGGTPSSEACQSSYSGGLTYQKVLNVNISHRVPNLVGHANASETGYLCGEPPGGWIYNTHNHGLHVGGSVATRRISVPDNGAGYQYYVNNSFDWRNTLQTTYDEAALFKVIFSIELWNLFKIYASGNTVIGEVDPATQEAWFRHRETKTIDGTPVTQGDLLQASEFTATNTPPPNASYLIPTAGADSLKVRDYLTTWAGPQKGTDSTGERTSNVDVYMADIIDDVTLGTNNSAPSGLLADDETTTGAKIPAILRSSGYDDGTDNNGIPEWFETDHGLTDDPFAVKSGIWDFSGDNDPDHPDYTVKNTAGYTNIEMYVWYINDYFWQLIDRGTVATDNSYIVNP